MTASPPRAGTVVRLGVAQTIAWASTYYLPAVLAVPMARTLGIAPTTVFAAFSVALLVAAAVGPVAGRAIDRLGGRPVLAWTAVVLAAGLGLMAVAQGPGTLWVAWVVLGVGMGTGLYEAAFAALVRLHGHAARGGITGVTLFAGFASTVGWPLTAWLESTVGWRGACAAWAGLHLLVAVPLYLGLPRVDAASPPPAAPAPDPAGERATGRLGTSVALAFVFAATWFISTAMAAHLPRLLQAGGVAFGTAVWVGALIGPAQVAARVLEFSVLRHVHPLLSARLAAALHPVGAAAFLAAGAPFAALFGVLHGAGNGIMTIAKGTLPLVFFGPAGYGERQGVLMVPARFAQAAAPWAFGACLDAFGVHALWLTAAVGALAWGVLMGLRAVEARREATA